MVDGTGRNIERLPAKPARDTTDERSSFKQALRALRDAPNRWRSLITASSALVWTADVQGAVHIEEPQWEAYTGLAVQPYQGWGWINAIHPDDREHVLAAWRRARARKRPGHAEFRITHRSGAYRYVKARAVPLTSEEGEVVEWVGTVTDIDEQKRAQALLQTAYSNLEERIEERTRALQKTNEELQQRIREHKQTQFALHRSRQRFSRIFRFGPFAALLVHPESGRITDANYRLVSMSGYSRDEIIGSTLSELKLFSGPFLQTEWMSFVNRYGGVRNIEVQMHTRSGHTYDVVVSTESIERDWCSELLVMLHDVTERRSLERDLQTISEQERQRIGQNLHDELGQQLVGAMFLARSLQRLIQEDDRPYQYKANDLVQQIEEALHYTRTFSRELVVLELKEGGLPQALRLLANKTEEYSGITCRVDIQGDPVLKPEFIDANLYRIAQEAVTNAVKHAEPSNIDLSLIQNGRKLVLRVEDDGIGIPPIRIRESSGIGLRTMRNRANLIGACLQIQKAPSGRGTQVICTLATAKLSDRDCL